MHAILSAFVREIYALITILFYFLKRICVIKTVLVEWKFLMRQSNFILLFLIRQQFIISCPELYNL